MSATARRAEKWTVGAPAIGAATLGALFLIGSLVWLAFDNAVPVYDAGMHMGFSLRIRDAFEAGHLGYWFATWTNYPPLVHVVGAIGLLIGGLNPRAPLVASLVVFVPLFVVGCYVTGRVAYGRLAGGLSVLFALGSPLLVAQFHTFMIDAPEAALVAASVAALLCSDRFRRPQMSVLAGVLCGLGLLTKQSFVAFLAGVVLVMLVRGGWRERRGLVLFAVPALIVAGPWYIYHAGQLHGLVDMANSGGVTSTVPGSPYPPRFSIQNLTFYWWSAVNLQLILPLCLFAVVGTVLSLRRFVRFREPDDYTPELVAGAVVGWLGMSWQAVHDPRYMLPATVYVAALGVGWLSRLPTKGRRIAICLLSGIVVLNTLGDTFGVGKRVDVAAGTEHPSSQLKNGELTLYSGYGYQGVSSARRQPALLPILRRLRATGARRIVGYAIPGTTDFSAAGLITLAKFAGLGAASPIPLNQARTSDAIVYHAPLSALRGQPPCLRLYNGTGVWFLRRTNLHTTQTATVCPR